MDIDNVPFHKLSLGQDDQKMDETIEVMQSLVLLPDRSERHNVEGTTKDEPKEEEGLTEMELRLQKEEEHYKLYPQSVHWAIK